MKESYTLDKYNSGRTVVGDSILEMAKDNPRIWLLTPDIGWGCKDFSETYPERFINTGIAEQCVVGVSAGLALEGGIPFIIGMMPFMSMRALEQVRTDLCYPNLSVRIIANYSGLTGNGGSTHYAMEDMALFSSLVNMTVCAPADPNQLRQIILKSVDWNGPMAIRMDPGRNNAVLYPDDTEFEIGKAHIACSGSDITIIACGEMVSEAIKISKTLEKDGIGVCIIDMFTIKPLDCETVLAAAQETGRIVTWEDHLMQNGLGSAVSDVIADNCVQLKSFKRFGIPQVYPGFGESQELYHKYGYDGEAVLTYIKSLLM
jgi:transketolase